MAPIDLAAGKLSGPAVLENFRSGRPDWSVDGKQIAYKITSPNGFQRLAIRSVDTGHVRTVPLSLQYLAEPHWLPDGRSMVSAGRDLKGRGGTFLIDVQTGRHTVINEMDGNTGRVQVSPDGKQIYYAVGGSPLRLVVPAVVERDLSTGQVREVFRRPPGMGAAELSPDGRFFAVVNGEYAKTSTLQVIPVGGGQPREFFHVSLPDALGGMAAWPGPPTARPSSSSITQATNLSRKTSGSYR